MALRIGMVTAFALACLGCGLFEPRTPEEPSQPSLDILPRTDPHAVVTNLQTAVDQKNVATYVSCFADPATTTRQFVFLASARYASVLSGWSLIDEQAYFQNMVANSTPAGTANLILLPKSSVETSDSVVYGYDYVLTFEVKDPSVPRTARGNLQFSLGRDNSGNWMIYQWADFKTTTDTTWSLFKVKFSN
jgi:hypothetical protein